MGLLKTHEATQRLREVQPRAQPRDLEGLLAQLQSASAAERRWAARDLAAHAEAAPLLGERLRQEADASVREALLVALGAIGSEAAVETLLPLLASEDAALRNGAIETLASLPQMVAPRIERLLRDPEPDVRIFTVNLLGELRHERVCAWLVQVLQHDAHINVVAAAIEAIAEVGAASELAVLAQARARFDDPFIAFAADLAAARIEAS